MSRTTKRPYRGSKSVDPQCRSHGRCPVCRSNREHKRLRQEPLDHFREARKMVAEQTKSPTPSNWRGA